MEGIKKPLDYPDVETTFRVTIAFALLATLGVILRAASRWLKGLRWGIDDYLILLALVNTHLSSWMYRGLTASTGVLLW